MDALVMCGGEGRRLAAETEKPLYPIAGEPMVDRVRRALADSSVEMTYAVVSPNAPETHEHLDRAAVPTIETPGEGYVADLGAALGDPRVDLPVLTVAADLPLLSVEIVDGICEIYRERAGASNEGDRPGIPATASPSLPSMTVCVPRELKRDLGVTVDESPVGADDLVPTGLNVIGTATDAGGGANDDIRSPDDEPDAGEESGADGDATDELVHVVREPAAAINVNRLEDARVAERHATR